MNRPRRALTVTALMLVLLGTHAKDVWAGDYTLVPDRFVSCTTCHGVELRGNRSVDAPRLNGMEDWYLHNQMQAFKTGWRGTHPDDLVGMEMQPQAVALDDQAIEDVVAFITSAPLRTSTIEHQVEGDAIRGRALYATCAACHGGASEGNRALNAPALAGQSDWYLLRQLQKYASGARGYAVEDTAGQQMRAATAVLTGAEDFVDVVAYINTLPAD